MVEMKAAKAAKASFRGARNADHLYLSISKQAGASCGRPFSLAPFSTHQNSKNSTDPLTILPPTPIYVNVINININI